MINDLLKSISSKDFVSAKEIVESLISEKISTLIDLKKIEVAENIFNESAYAPEERLADLTKIKTATLQQIHALHRHYGQKDPRSKESANRAAVELKKRGIIVPIDEALTFKQQLKKQNDFNAVRQGNMSKQEYTTKWERLENQSNKKVSKPVSEGLDEAWKHEDEAGKRAHGEFQEKDHGKWFTYRKTDDPWAAKHGLTHKIDVADGHRFGKVMGTRVHIATDENDDGSPKMETWHLKKHNKWTQNESVEIEESELTESKIDHHTALDILNQAGGSTSDFHELGSNEVDTLLKHAKIHKYRKSPSAPGSTARMFHQHLTKIVRANEKSGPSWK